jgi:hypothetical protein
MRFRRPPAGCAPALAGLLALALTGCETGTRRPGSLPGGSGATSCAAGETRSCACGEATGQSVCSSTGRWGSCACPAPGDAGGGGSPDGGQGPFDSGLPPRDGGPPPPDAGFPERDAGFPEADAGFPIDLGFPSFPDAAPPDGGFDPPDLGFVDAGFPDSGVGFPDASPPDLGFPDSGPRPDAGPLAGCASDADCPSRYCHPRLRQCAPVGAARLCEPCGTGTICGIGRDECRAITAGGSTIEQVCLSECAVNADCPRGYSCQFGGFCYPTPGAIRPHTCAAYRDTILGSTCDPAMADVCGVRGFEDGTCVLALNQCSVGCDLDADCPTGTSCLVLPIVGGFCL